MMSFRPIFSWRTFPLAEDQNDVVVRVSPRTSKTMPFKRSPKKTSKSVSMSRTSNQRKSPSKWWTITSQSRESTRRNRTSMDLCRGTLFGSTDFRRDTIWRRLHLHSHPMEC
uniref:(northern house mosquito) hypothetical protein n=1 Tax=Culex pipiens TaxID=7175 RepID=A0A8D8D6C2_CULPI